MTLDEYSDYHNDYMLYPDWFAEGTAQLICGFYHDSFTVDLFNKISIKENDGVTYTKERIKAQYTEKIRTLDSETYSQDNVFGSYCYGPLAVMYLLDRHLQASGNPSALKYDEDGTLTYVNVAELRDSMSDVLLLLHSEKTLDEIIQDTLGEDCDTFEDMFIGGEEAGNTSLDFCTDVLNYLEKASKKIGERATGSILQDFDRPYSDLWIFDENETSDYYNFVITDNNYATSTADPEIAEKSKPAKIFDQEAYRAAMAEKENAALVGTGARNVSAGEAGASGNAALPEQDTAAEAKAAPEQGAAAEAKAVPETAAASEPAAATGQEAASEHDAAAEISSVPAAETVSPAEETAVRDEPAEEAGGYDYEESAGADCSEEQTDVSESSAWETVSECEPSGYAA
jgi:hypothetical protein